VNIYAYAGSNPISGRDPLGLMPLIPEPLYDATVAVADSLSFGVGPLLRKEYDTEGPNGCSRSCQASSVLGIIASFATSEGEVKTGITVIGHGSEQVWTHLNSTLRGSTKRAPATNEPLPHCTNAQKRYPLERQVRYQVRLIIGRAQHNFIS
jgi:hypothetical protein